MPDLLALDRQTTGNRSRVKNVLVLLEQGGLSQMDTWDPKPNAIAEHRSPYKPIATAVSGTRVGELLPRLARLADRYCLIRSMSHVNANVLKVKLATALIGISSIHLLKTFIEIGTPGTTEQMVLWQVVVHLTFVASALLLAWTDRISSVTAVETRTKAH